jgi:hypothetical protein
MNQAMDTLDAILQSSAAGPQPFPPTSRYYGVPVATRAGADGRLVPYLTRRFVPQTASFATLAMHSVVQGDRLDNLAARYFGDPEQWWRLCDANGVVHPGLLTATIGTSVRITMPVGIPAGIGGR